MFFLDLFFPKRGIARFEHHSKELILEPSQTEWQRARVYNPATIVVGDKVAMLYRAQGSERILTNHHWNWPSVIGLAWSDNGIDFVSESLPVLEPRMPYEKAGVEDPRIVHIDGKYIMTYTAFDGDRARLCITTTSSPDFHSWEKQYVLFPDERRWTKSGAILAERINGRYYMYFQMHEADISSSGTSIWLAQSSDLRHWETYEFPVLVSREKHFDDLFVEPGPPPILCPEGILLIYNAAKKSRNGDGRTFSVGWALFDKHDPSQIIARCEEPFLIPKHYSEKHGRVPNVSFRSQLKNDGRISGTLFAEGLVRFRNQWLLYYGMGDTVIGVAASRSRRLFSK